MKVYTRTKSQDVSDIFAYNGYLRFDANIQTAAPIVENDSVLYADGDRGSVLNYSSANNSYSSMMTLFFQQLTLENDKTNFKTFVLYPASQSMSTPAGQNGSKSVHRVVFPKDKIKLKVYYTKPTTEK